MSTTIGATASTSSSSSTGSLSPSTLAAMGGGWAHGQGSGKVAEVRWINGSGSGKGAGVGVAIGADVGDVDGAGASSAIEPTPPPIYSAQEFKTLMKATEEMVTKARLDQIAVEHKSSGAILDTRVLHEIVEPCRLPKKSKLKLKTDMEAAAAKDMAESAAAEKFASQHSTNKLLRGDYSVEHQVWREKSVPTAYSQKRRFQFPHLQRFKDVMGAEQGAEFKRRVGMALIQLADRYREECRVLKQEMDLNAIFHPEANAHRVHCIYLMKLYKGICSDNLEDPILRQMHAEAARQKEAEAALAQQKEELETLMEAADLQRLTPGQREDAERSKRRAEREEGLVGVEKGVGGEKGLGVEKGGGGVGVEKGLGVEKGVGVEKGLVGGEKGLVGGEKGEKEKGEKEKGQKRRESVSFGGVSGGGSAKLVRGDSNTSIGSTKGSRGGFGGGGSSKITRDDIGGDFKDEDDFGGREKGPSKSGKLLRSGMVKVQSVSVIAGVKVEGGAGGGGGSSPGGRRRSVLNKTGTGTTGTMTGNTGTRHSKSAPQLHDEEHSQTTERVKETPLQKSNDKLFKKLRSGRLGGAEGRTLLHEEAGRLDEGESFSLRRQRDKNGLLEEEMSSWMLSSVQRQQISKSSSGASTTAGGFSAPLKLPTSITQLVGDFNDSLRPAPSSPTKMLQFGTFSEMFQTFRGEGEGVEIQEDDRPHRRKKREEHSGTGSPGSNTSSSPTAPLSQPPHASPNPHNPLSIPPEPSNLLKLLGDMDKNFDAYLKVAEHVLVDATKDSSDRMRAKLNSSIAQPRRVRKSNPLGKSAVHLTDSRGRTSKDSKKGFSNIFRNKDEDKEEEDQDVVLSDDLMGRLRADEDDELTLSQHSDSLSFTHNLTVSHTDLQGGNSNSPGASGRVTFEPPSPGAGSRKPGTLIGMGGGWGESGGVVDAVERSPSRSRRISSREKDSKKEAGDSAKEKQRDKDKEIRDSRERERREREREEEEDEAWLNPPEPNAEQGMQDKLLAAWECLQVPASQRFAFMRKYSTDEYCMEMGRAVDLWSESAVYVVAILELTKLTAKIKSGNCIMPLTFRAALKTFRIKLPALLGTNNAFFIPPSLGYYDPKIPRQTEPLSYCAVVRVTGLIEGAFQSRGTLGGGSGGTGTDTGTDVDAGKRRLRPYVLSGVSECSALTTHLLQEITVLLKASLRFVHTELGDQVPYGARWCREWLFSLTLPKEGVKEEEKAPDFLGLLTQIS